MGQIRAGAKRDKTDPETKYGTGWRHRSGSDAAATKAI